MYQLIELLAVVSSAIYGVLLARRHQMDFVGVFCMAFIISFGGGTLRDLFLDRHPLFWIGQSHYSVIVFVISLFGAVVKRVPASTERYLSVPDALGLGLFSVAGANAALDSGTSFFIASLMGAVTGTFGGVIGDVICNRVPSVFRPAPLFATCSFVGCWIWIGLRQFEMTVSLAAPVAICVIVAMRLIAINFQVVLPHIKNTLDEDSDADNEE